MLFLLSLLPGTAGTSSGRFYLVQSWVQFIVVYTKRCTLQYSCICVNWSMSGWETNRVNIDSGVEYHFFLV